jgi:hypothetical protein
LLFSTTIIGLALAGRYLGNRSLPLLHIELIVLAPFLRSRVGLWLMLVSLFTESARVVQSLFGFDQLFVSLALLLHNLCAFPVSYSLRLVLLLVAALAGLVIVLHVLPSRRARVGPSIAAAALALLGGGKAAEDSIKQNLVGTAYGYLAGQASFSTMFKKGYTVPGGAIADHPAEQAAKQALAGRQDLWLVVVESMGLPSDITLKQELLEPFVGRTDLSVKYEIESGQLASVGSTIHGELRALCGGQLSRGLFDNGSHDCLPQRLAAAGYSTHAVHANAAFMYGRDIWYPKIGFQTYSAGGIESALSGDAGKRWGTLLDGDTIAWMSGITRIHDQPSFTYLLTVSTHLPAEPLPGSKPLANCLAKATEHACLHLANLRLVMNQLAAAARERNDTMILIIGDHPPPFVSPGSRSAFSATDVPWIKLRPR